jgi:hypothetical protein
MSGATGYRGLSFEAFWALPEYFPSYVSIRCRVKGLLGDCRRTGAHLTISADIAALEIGMPGPFRKQSTALPNRSSGAEESSIESRLYAAENES